MKRVCEGHEAVTDNQARNCWIETNIERLMTNHRCKEIFIPSLSTPDVKLIMNNRHVTNFIDNKNQFFMNNDDKSNNNNLSPIYEKVTPRFHANKQCDGTEKDRVDISLVDKVSSSEYIQKLSSNLFENNKSFSSYDDLTSLMKCQTVSNSKTDSHQLNDLTSSAMKIFTDKVAEEVDILEESKQIKPTNLNKNLEDDEIFKVHCIRCNKPLLHAVNIIENNSQKNMNVFTGSHNQLEHQDNEKKIIGQCFPTVKKTMSSEHIYQDYLFRNPDSLSDIDQITPCIHTNIKFQQNYDGDSSTQRYVRNAEYQLPSSNEIVMNISDNCSINIPTNNKFAMSEVKSLNAKHDEKTAFCREIIRVRQNLKSPLIIREKNKNYSIGENNFAGIINEATKHLPHKNFDNSCDTTDNEWNSSDENQDNDNDEQLNKVVFPKETKRAMAILLRSSRENREYKQNHKEKMINKKE